ncbi:MAG: hypothetical protein VX204_03895 [Candidatus Thermoplasmatota archaeon]|nr:hypothetical protein [Candidatus Thermoplasmatota archaeon]
MEVDELLGISPEQLAQALLVRRQVLKQELPNVIRNLEAEEDLLEPQLKRAVDSHRKANDAVAKHKQERNRSQSQAAKLLIDVKDSKDNLMEADGMVNLDPNWKKEKLLDELEEIENEIQTSALDHRSERKLLDRRKKLLEENERWLKSRRDSNPEMSRFIDSRKEMISSYRKADTVHRKMLDAVSKAQPLHEKKILLTAELREIRRQMDRARELLDQSDLAIGHWQKRLDSGFGELGGGFRDLMAASNKVSSGGRSSFARNRKVGADSKADGGEEE